MRHDLVEKCESIASLFGSGDDTFMPESYSNPIRQFSRGKDRSSLGIRCYSVMNYFREQFLSRFWSRRK